MGVKYKKDESQKEDGDSAQHHQSIYEALCVPARDEIAGEKHIGDMAMMSSPPYLQLIDVGLVVALSVHVLQ